VLLPSSCHGVTLPTSKRGVVQVRGMCTTYCTLDFLLPTHEVVPLACGVALSVWVVSSYLRRTLAECSGFDGDR